MPMIWGNSDCQAYYLFYNRFIVIRLPLFTRCLGVCAGGMGRHNTIYTFQFFLSCRCCCCRCRLLFGITARWHCTQNSQAMGEGEGEGVWQAWSIKKVSTLFLHGQCVRSMLVCALHRRQHVFVLLASGLRKLQPVDDVYVLARKWVVAGKKYLFELAPFCRGFTILSTGPYSSWLAKRFPSTLDFHLLKFFWLCKKPTFSWDSDNFANKNLVCQSEQSGCNRA